ncbi:laminin subunit alpha-3-like isoform X3 [Polypterus senegalus]|uniref:laminin subunit alpha-3-like isoform X3 n=1 Tax=Polypterus senegalus TaxID=55291 RepID=UPI00196248F6|nr:laminin subunit alpha-3-like isoform X3 [Polypterus senegalus]
MSNMARRSREEAATVLLAYFLLSPLCPSGFAQIPLNEITGFSLHPPYFNLAEGARISATATCGQDETGRSKLELYCKLVGGPTTGLTSQTIQGQFCDYCNSNDPNAAHPITNAIDGTERWWQSPPLSRGLKYNEVNVTLDLGQLFHVAYVLIKFANSPRPDLWVLERSVDFGRTYSPWQYFAHSKIDCIETFGKIPNQRIVKDDDQICSTEYSRIVPLENGEIVVSLVNGRPGAKNFSYSPVLREFTKATNIRLRFLRTNTLLGHLISKAQRDPTVTRRYYYSIKDISIGGRCVCHGHALVCDAKNPENRFQLQCDCQHNTCGESCERCCPGYNQKPWQAATSESANPCEQCNCHSHASDCYYDPEVERMGKSLNIHGRYEGGGVCIDCQHNTAGVNCERCAEGYYRPYGIPKESPTGCRPCRCDPQFTAGCEDGSGICFCKPNYSGKNCNQCAEGYYGFPQCQRIPIYPTRSPSAGHIVEPKVCPSGYFGPPNCKPCQCTGPGVVDPTCDPQTGECRCRTEFQGVHCEQCAPQYFNYPYCQACNCNTAGTIPAVCDFSGRCLCRPEVEGPLCDRCHVGLYNFPVCQACACDGLGAVDRICGPRGQCRCYSNYIGLTCNFCAPGYYGYPNCFPCQCSPEGSFHNTCDRGSGQCPCLMGVTGQRCDQCATGSIPFPHCQTSHCHVVGTDSNNSGGNLGTCQCLPDVEGSLCDKCKPLYWNLSPENPDGCIECQCDVKGTISGVGECQQKNGECFCKPNICSHTCNACRDGYFHLEKTNYFGCQGCECDIGGSASLACDERSGVCQCRKHIVGRTCNQPEIDHYFPDLHHLRYEIEDGTTPNGRMVRLGYDIRQFPGFSWRGYAVMSPVQPEVVLPVSMTSPSLFLIIIRYATPSAKKGATGRISVAEGVQSPSCCNWPIQNKDIFFPPSLKPAFITVPGNGFADPFALTPGKWIINIKAEGVLLDYLVMLPSNYFEAPILQMKVTEPCTYDATLENSYKHCLMYKHVPIDKFPNIMGTEGLFLSQSGLKIQIESLQPAPHFQEMAYFSGKQAKMHLKPRVPRPGNYVVVLEYANKEETVQNVNVVIENQPQAFTQGRANIYSCKYSFLCRSVVIDAKNRIAVYDISTNAELQLHTSTASFFLNKVYLVPAEEFTMELVEPKIHCIAKHGHFTENSSICVPSKYEIPQTAVLLDAVSDGRLSLGSESTQSHIVLQSQLPNVIPPYRQGKDALLLKSPQNQLTFNTRISNAGQYVVVIHYLQPEHAAFPVEIVVDGGRPWMGSFSASFCPHVYGCRDQVIADNRIALDIPDQELLITLKVPHGKTLLVDYILVVSVDNYSPDILSEKPLDLSFDFINNCGENSFYIDFLSSTQFCQDMAKSLVAFNNDGALPCNCDTSGSTSSTCNPQGGQCPCKPNVIGRQCSRCAMGFYSFPVCKPCSCGNRLCDEITGQCICPPQTVKPSCNICQKKTFGYHPLVGCEGCNCSESGIVNLPHADCDRSSGQCKCKPKVTGRQCDRCAPGYFNFPECIPCNCETGGTKPNVCDPHTGQCICKENVGGRKCNTCRTGSFYFDPNNPKGCTSCFCFGATEQCESSKQHRSKFVDMNFWRLEKLDKEKIPVVFNPASNTVVADVQELPDSIHDLYWVAPAKYLGDRISSYGGFLTYQIKSFGLPSEGMALLEKRPDIQLTGQQMTLIFIDPHNHSPGRLYHGRVQLVEGNFRHATTNSPVSREEMMMVLAGLDGLRIRALYFTESQRLTLGEVGLEDVSPTGSGIAALSVEVCKCPPEVRGDSCQKCAPGYYRDKGLYLGRCVPCSCNGLANECEDGSGKCLNCQRNAAGDKCERCKDGFYGNPIHGTCKVCPCPFTSAANSFAIGCKQEENGSFECLCKPGYTGPKCERCAPGYYGDPLAFEGECRLCNCGGNGNSGSCDPLTGVCRNLEPKDISTDEQCDECDSCVQTLLSDLERLELQMISIKSSLQNLNASSGAQERLRSLEMRIDATKNELNRYQYDVNSRRVKIDQLNSDTIGLSQDISILKEQAERNFRNVQNILNNLQSTNNRATTLVSDVLSLFINIQEFLSKIKIHWTSNDSEKLVEAERLVQEMKQRNFNRQRGLAEKEKEEALKLLNRVKNSLQKQLEQNQKSSKRLSEMLNQYDAKLKDLRDALTEASGAVNNAKDINKANVLLAADTKQSIDELKNEKSKVENQIKVTQDQMKQISDLMRMLDGSLQEYEREAAQLDGAKRELTEKVKKLSQVGSKADIVMQAEEHARNLDKQAKELKEALKNASSSSNVQYAIEATEAYKNITDAVKAAEEAAKKAEQAANSAMQTVVQQDLEGKAKTLKSNGDQLQTDARNAEAKWKEAVPKLDDIQNRLATAERKKLNLQNELTEAQKNLNLIKRDDIGSTINAAKNMAELANSKVNDVLKELQPIQAEVNEIKEKNGGSPSDPNFNNVLDDVSKSIQNISSTIPSLLEKITQVEERSRELSPSSNITDNVERIKELIRQARDAANKIVVPMMFNGNARVEVHPPSNLEDLKAYTALSVFLQRPLPRGDRRRRQTSDSGNMFVLYLGNKNATKDYIAMALRDNKLFSVYNLGGKEYEIRVDSSVTKTRSDESVQDKISLERIYQNAQLIYTKAFTSTNPDLPLTIQQDGNYQFPLLNLDPKDVVFYVGGYPPEFMPPASISKNFYRGCLELDMLNEQRVSLYHFKEAVDVNLESPCKRYNKGSDQYYFEGTGYAQVNNTVKIGRFEQSIQTSSQNGVLFFLGNEENYLLVSMLQGKLAWTYKSKNYLDTGTSQNVLFNGKSSVNLGIYLRQKDFMIYVAGIINKSNFSMSGEFTEYYVGGIPNSIRKKYQIDTPPLRGCVKGVKTPERSAQFVETVGVSKGCSDDLLLTRSASCKSQGFLDSDPNGFSIPDNFMAALGFRTTEGNGLLLNNNQADNTLSLSLEDGYVTFKINNKMLRSNQKYADGSWHHLMATRNSLGTTLLIDENDMGGPYQGSPPNIQEPPNPNVYLGGGSFDGCISDVYLRRSTALYSVEDFRNYSKTGDVSLDMCRAEKPPQSIMLKEVWNRTSLRMDKVKVMEKGSTSRISDAKTGQSSSGCILPKSVRDAFSLRDSPLLNRLEYDFNPTSLQNGLHFSLDIRTVSTEGLIFYISNQFGTSHLALFILKGRFVYSLSSFGRKRRITSKEKYNNGQWNTVMFSTEQNNMRLIINGLRVQNGTFPRFSALELQSPIFLGAVPALKENSALEYIPKDSVTGCFRNFKLNGQLMVAPTINHGITPCFEGKSERGAYFAGSSAYAVLDPSFIIGLSFELVFEIRPSGLNGILFYIGSQSGDHLTLYMKNGKVIVQVDNGAGAFNTSVTPLQPLCDGTFHRIAVIKRNNVVQLDVDTERNHTVGPSSSLSTDTKDPLYIGGIPGRVINPKLPVHTSFQGCLQNVKLNSIHKPLSKITEVYGPVSVSGCPVI